MIELIKDALVFTFPEVHPAARLTVTFQRTLRIPDDGREYPLPPGLGTFHMRHVDDHAATLPPAWLRHGGVMLPIHQAEALWIDFDSARIDHHETPYPFAVKVACGKIDALSGERWTTVLRRRPGQNYLVVPEQPWLDGYCVDKGTIRQFVAMPLGAGYSAEEQLTGRADSGGIQIQVMPMRREVFNRRFPYRYPESTPRTPMFVTESPCEYGMGLAPGGRMRQEVAEDPYRLADWERKQRSRCFVHLANARQWSQITGEQPPATPVTAMAYTAAGLPWFSWYDETITALPGSKKLARLKSVAAMGRKKHRRPLPDNQTVKPQPVLQLHPKREPEQVREMKS